LLHKTEFNMPITLLPSLILLSISKMVASVASRMDPRYLNLLTAVICPVSVLSICYINYAVTTQAKITTTSADTRETDADDRFH
jgi:hypothetical protein